MYPIQDQHFKEGTIEAVVVEPSLMGIAEVEDVEVNEGKEGQVITSIMEIKTGFFARTPAIYPRLVEFLHFDIQSTGQKSHCVNTITGHRSCGFTR